LHADKSINFLSVLENKQRRNALYPKTPGGHLICIDVKLSDADLSAELFGQLLDDRRDHAARPAPGCPEIDQNRERRLLDLGCKILVGNYQRRNLNGKRRSALAANGLPRRINPVFGAACGTGNDLDPGRGTHKLLSSTYILTQIP
jgi:hypothetical protein